MIEYLNSNGDHFHLERENNPCLLRIKIIRTGLFALVVFPVRTGSEFPRISIGAALMESTFLKFFENVG